MPRWITGRELIDLWGIKEFELFDLIRNGLQPYTKYGVTIVDSDSLKHAPAQSYEQIRAMVYERKYYYFFHKLPPIPISKFRGFLFTPQNFLDILARSIFEAQKSEIVPPPGGPFAYMGFRLPASEDEARLAISKLMSCMFKLDDVAKFAKQHGLRQPSGKTDRDNTSFIDRPQKGTRQEIMHLMKESYPGIEIRENLFLRCGDSWFVKYDGETTILGSLKRLRYIVTLIDKTGCKFFSSDLVSLVEGHEVGSTSASRSLSLSSLESSLTHEQRKRIENIGRDLWKELQEAEDGNDQKQIDSIKERFEKYRKYMLDEYGIKVLGRKRVRPYFRKMHRFGPEAEKARKLVRNHIDNSYKYIENRLPRLAKHLRDHIKYERGYWFYEPNPNAPVQWYILDNLSCQQDHPIP